MTKLNALSALKKLLRKRGVKVDFYFDRLTLYLDAKNNEQDIANLLNDNAGKNKFIREPLPHNDFYDRKIEMFQPSRQCLQNLKINGDCAIRYVEFALDFCTTDQNLLDALVRFFKRHLVYITGRHSTACCNTVEDTVYFSNPNTKKRLVFYSDKKSRKHRGQKCLHLEYRVDGWELVKTLNLITFADLAEFDHEQLWNRFMDLRHPHFQSLGQELKGNEISRQMLHRCAKKEWQTIELLQDYLAQYPQRISAFKMFSSNQLIKCLNQHFQFSEILPVTE